MVCACGRTAKVVDTGKEFYVVCKCRLKSDTKQTENDAIRQWESKSGHVDPAQQRPFRGLQTLKRRETSS